MTRRFWKRVGIVVGAVFVLVAWVVVGVVLKEQEPMPSFGFLNGRTVALRFEQNKKDRYLDQITREVYSFQVDSNDICAQADEELLALGFVEGTQPWPQWNGRRYNRRDASGELITVRVLDRHKAFEHPQGFEAAYGQRNGWVSIEVARERRSSWRGLGDKLVAPLRRWGLLK